MRLKIRRKEIVMLIPKSKYFFLMILFALPFLLLIINKTIGIDFGGLYTFEMDIKDFFTIWVTAFGVIGLFINILLNSKRLKNQEEVLALQTKDERNSRFAKAVELLGNNKETVRIGGINALYSLAKEYPKEFSELVFNILCSYISITTSDQKYRRIYKKEPATEIQIVFDKLFGKERRFVFPNLIAKIDGSFLDGLEVDGKDFGNNKFFNVSFRNSHFRNCSFNKSEINLKTDFSGSTFNSTKFEEAFIYSSKFEDCKFLYCSVEKASIKSTAIKKSFFHECNFKYADLMHIEMIEIIIHNCNLSHSAIRDRSKVYCSNIDKTEFVGSIIDFKTEFIGTEIVDCLFDAAYLNDVSFYNSLIKNTSILGGGDFHLSDEEMNNFLNNNEEFYSKRLEKDSVFTDSIRFGKLKQEQVDKILKPYNINENKLEKVKRIKSKKEDFRSGILGK